jgi:DNA-binding CsgD family transcriptional regulator
MGRLDLPDPPRDEDELPDRGRAPWPQRLRGLALGEAELDVLAGASRGETQAETAARRGCASETVKTQRRVVIAKLGARNMRDAIRIAIEDRILQSPRREIADALLEQRPRPTAGDAIAPVSRAIAIRDWPEAFRLLCRSVCSERVAVAFLLEQGLPAELLSYSA